MTRQMTLGDELCRLGAEFEPLERSGCWLTGAQVENLRLRLGLLARLARNQEQELAVHRLIEASRQIHRDVEIIASEAADRLGAFRDNVLRPDFTGGKKP